MTTATNTVRVVIDGRIVEAQGLRRTTTLLDFLREHQPPHRHQGRLRGGGLWRRVVLVGELDGEGGRCTTAGQRLPAVAAVGGRQEHQDGRGLARATAPLHPVQQSMIDLHGSQCGFCTPGIV